MDKLQAQGWYLTEQGWNIVSDSESIVDLQKLAKGACDIDLREIGSGQGDVTGGNVVLQIQKLKNIAAPKGNEESRSAPRMLKLSLTDGKNNYQAVEIEKITGLSLDTPPGTKILLKSGEIIIIHGIVLLGPSNIAKVLGGKVTNLVEKWELNRKLATHSRLRSVDEGGPPPWIPFGKKIMKGGVEGDKNFKALGVGKDAATDKEATEFEAQRQDAIAEAARLGGKKVFGGGNKQLLDHSVKKIVDQGFSVEQAEFALKMNRNNVDRALKSLQRTSDNRSAGPREPRESRELRPKRFEKKPEETKPSSGKVSLFDFLEDKLPAQNETSENSQQQSQQFHQYNQHHHQPQQQQQQHHRSNENSGNFRLENHFERLEMRGSEYSQAGKGGRAQKGGRGHQPSARQASYDTKFSKRSTTEVYNPFASSNTTFANANQSKAPRFQRNHEPSSNSHQDNVFKGNYGKSSLTNDRKIPNAHFGQSRNEIVSTSVESSINNHANKNNRDDNRSSAIKNNQNVDKFQTQQADSDQKSKHGSVHEAAGHVRHNRIQQDAIPHQRTQATANFHFDNKNNRNENNRPSQQSIATNNRETNNFGNNRNLENDIAGGNWSWKAGDDCMAKYWEDNRYYNAQVTAVSARTCVVLFKDFHNYEEVLKADCIPITDKFDEVAGTVQSETRRVGERGYAGRPTRYDQSDNHISAGMEFRRGGGGGGVSGVVGGVGNVGSKGYNRKRGQQRSAQAIYQPPAQRGHSSATWTPRNNPTL